jgi:CBS-domain-containing membrane protein
LADRFFGGRLAPFPAVRPRKKWPFQGRESLMQARDVMTVNVIAVRADAPIHEVVDLLLKHRISALPVIDAAQRVVGIVSEGDLLRPEGVIGAERRPWWLAAMTSRVIVSYENAGGRTAGAIMTRNVISVDEETPVSEIAALLERNLIKRVPVLKDGKLVGIVSRANLLHGLAHTIVDHHEPNAASDRELRRRLTKLLLDDHRLDTVFLNVTVIDGNVRLWGIVENADEAAAAVRAAKNLPRGEVGREQSPYRLDVRRTDIAAHTSRVWSVPISKQV